MRRHDSTLDPNSLRISVLLAFAIVAALERLSHISLGIASGGLVGLPGRERDLADMQRRSMQSLVIGGLFEGAAVMTAVWLLSPIEAAWARTLFAIALAGTAVFVTFQLVH